MSSPESITVSLEWATKLKEAGWPQGLNEERGCLFCIHYHPDRGTWIDGQGGGTMIIAKNGKDEYVDTFAAPTAEEILRRLPHTILQVDDDRIECDLCCIKEADMSWTIYFDKHKGVPFKNDDTLANAAAAMFCYVKENDLLPAEQ